MEQVGLEIREANPNLRQSLTSRYNCYQAELKRLQQEFTSAKSAKVSSGGYESVEEFDEIGIQEDQKRRLLDNTERLERTGNYLKDGYRIALEAEQIGTNVLNELSQQRETIQKSRAKVGV